MTEQLSEMVVFVTGASRGIGHACAKGFLNEGARVVTLSRGSSDLDQSVEHGGRLMSITGDIGDLKDVERAVKSASQQFGRIDVLVNNAGLLSKGAFLHQPFEEWVQAVTVNLTGLAFITRLVLPGMLARGFGRVINIVSRAVENPHPDLSAYSASKAGVVSFTRSLATEITSQKYPDVQVNGLIPGLTRTAMFDQLGWPADGVPGPESIYPHIRRLALTPPGSPHGRIFWGDEEYVLYKDFAHPPVIHDISEVPAKPVE